MQITVDGVDIHDCKRKLGMNDSPQIKIYWRTDRFIGYGCKGFPGCIVDATCIGEETKISFDNMGDAIKYIESLLNKRNEEIEYINANRT